MSDRAAPDVTATAEEPAWLLAAVARGREAWPTVDVDARALAACLRAKAAAGAAEKVVTTTLVEDADLDAAELYLACACERGDRAALLAFRDRYVTPLEGVLARMGLEAAQRDDVWQQLALRLFVAHEDGPARIVQYAGRGELHGLVKVAATRLALDALARQPRQEADAWLDGLTGGRSDPELHWIKQQHRDELKQELEAAIARLDERDRTLLRLSLVERLGIDAIATTYRTHRATVARWIAKARETIGADVRERLKTRWKLAEGELDQLGLMLDSQLDLSLERLLSAG